MNLKRVAAIGVMSATIAVLAVACGTDDAPVNTPAEGEAVGIGMPVPPAPGSDLIPETEVVGIGMPVPAEEGSEPIVETEVISIGMPVPGRPQVPEMSVEHNSPKVFDDQPITTEPITSADGILANHCNFIHNVDACFVDGQMPDVALDEYMHLYFDARDLVMPDDLGKVRIKSVEPVEWTDASLGRPDPDTMYAQVITLGFKLTLEYDGLDYLFHTSSDRVVFVSEG